MKIYTINGASVILHEGELYVKIDTDKLDYSEKPKVAKARIPILKKVENKEKGFFPELLGKKRGRPKKEINIDFDEATEEEAEALAPIHADKPVTADIRAKIQELKRAGMNSASIARELKVNLETVNKHWN